MTEPILVPQSGTTSDNNITKVSSNMTVQNIKFSGAEDPYLYDVDSNFDPTRRLQDSSDAELGNFFSRPIKIHDLEWGTGLELYSQIDPWSLYFENPRVSNRLANYNLLRANLRVRFVINGNGFQYGRAISSYLPFDRYDQLSSNASLIKEDLVQASQQPHIFLDPTTSTGGEMKLPMFYYRNYLSIPDSQWKELGLLTIRSINALKHANGASDKVTVSVFAWAEDVAMSVLTSVNPDSLTPQSGEIDKANTSGIVSGPATMVAKAAMSMSAIPALAPFALATSTAATAVGGAAKALGYCRPPITKTPEPFRAKESASLALTNTPDLSLKMTVDEKQELSIDPRIAGLGTADCLSIKEIAKRESYLTTFEWPIGTAPETLLWNARIDPVTWATSQATGAYHFPACAMAALPFKYWTGSMKFRFQIVCSSFHKGRLKLVYDPNILLGSEYNTNYLNIVDISDEQDLTIEIANGQDVTLISHHLPGPNSSTELHSSTLFTQRGPGNGVLGVYVVNELTTPNSEANNDIQVNVYVSMGDDFEVFVPDDHFQTFTLKPRPAAIDEELDPQSGEIIPESQETSEPSAPQQEMSTELGPTKSDNSDINMVYTGEAITSFRTMLKRYNLWNAIGPKTTQEAVMYGRFAAMPYPRGYVADAVNSSLGGVPYNYCNTVMLHWVTYAFSGWRGGIRYKMLPRGNLGPGNRPTVYIQRHGLGELEYQRGSDFPIEYLNDTEVSNSVVRSVPNNFPNVDQPFTGAKGQIYTCGYVNPAVEFEVPYYSPFRFSAGKTESYTGISLWSEGWDYRIWLNGNASTTYDIHVASAEDFQVYFWTGLPKMYYEQNPPLTN